MTYEGAPSPSLTDELKLLPLSRLRVSLRIAIVAAPGLASSIEPAREDALEAVSDGGGSLDFAD